MGTKFAYSLANEDARVEFGLMPSRVKRAIVVGGSGARAVPLLARNPGELIVVESDPVQLHFCELRLQAARSLKSDEFLFFMGYRGALPNGRPAGDSRMDLFETLELSDKCREFWGKASQEWLPRGFIYLGTWESRFQTMHKILQGVLRMNLRAIFEAQSLDEQIALYEKHWRPQLFRNFLRFAASEFVLNRFVYKTPHKSSPPRAPWQIFDEEFRRLFTTTLVRRSFFLQLLFLGEILYEEGLPFEALQSTLEGARRSRTVVHYRNEPIAELVRSEAAGFYSLGDITQSLTAEECVGLLLSIPKSIPAKSLVVCRSFLHVPEAFESKGWLHESAKEDKATLEDCTGVYRFHIYSKSADRG